MTDQTPTTTKPNPLRNVGWTLARFLAGLTVGMLVAFALVVAVELASAVVHPLPPDFGGTQEEMCAHVARYPAWVLALVVPAWALTAFIGTWTAKRLGVPLYGSGLLTLDAGLFVGLLLTAAVLSNVLMLPYPLWFKIASPLAVAGAVFAASRPRP